MSLYRTELRRLGKRRFTRYMTLIGLLVLGAIAAGVFFSNQKLGPEQVAAAERAAEQDYQRSVQESARYKQECEQARAAGTATTDQYPPDCADIQKPPRDSFQAEWYMPATFEFRKEFPESLTALAAILALVAFSVGASFVGAEWSTGGMMNLLLWRPRRVSVLLTKLGALLTGLAGLIVVATAAWTAAFWAVGTFRGETRGMTSGAWQSVALTGLRGAVLVMLAATVGFALASLGRHTALALGGAIGVMIVGQFGLGIVLSMAQVKFVEMWLLPTYLLAWMQQKITLENWESCQYAYTGDCNPEKFDVTWQASGTLFAIGVVLTLGAAIWAMRRRDIS